VLTAQLKKIEREKKKRIKRRAVTRTLSEKRKRKQKPICGIECFLEKGEKEKKKDQWRGHGQKIVENRGHVPRPAASVVSNTFFSKK